MRQFFWKIVICLTPCLLAAWVTTVATVRYYNGEPGGFKFGVDLVGGTILVYEIDMTKQLERDQANPSRDTHLLAESLKRRIDPNDLFNIMIRPAGGEGRVEIILPTGGTHRAEVAEQAWKKLLGELSENYKLGKKYGTDELEIGRGKILELANAIHVRKSQKIWDSDKVFGSTDGWNEFIKNTYQTKIIGKDGKVTYEPNQKFYRLKDPRDPSYAPAVASTIADLGQFGPSALVWGINLPQNEGAETTLTQLFNPYWRFVVLPKQPNLTGFSEILMEKLQEGTSERTIEAWIKEQAWDRMLNQARLKWPEINSTLYNPSSAADRNAMKEGALGFMVNITPDSHEEMVGFIQTKGNIIGAAGLAVLEPLLGKEILFDGKGEATEMAKHFVSYQEADQFIQDHYGPSFRAIVKDIEDEYRKGGRTKDLTVEEVNRIKELVSKVGSLEFRILANEYDDADGMAAAKEAILKNKGKWKESRERGEVPLGPRLPGSDKARVFKIDLARGESSKVTYSWVELGPPMRKDLGLDNASENAPEPYRYKIWQQAKTARTAEEATQLKHQDDRKALNGALFFSRNCENQNLPEEERKSKAIEYFVLTRDPEIDPTDPLEIRRVPKVDGSYLIQAAPDRQGVTPAVHFVFNSAGGDLFGNLTRKNVPDRKGGDENKRHLAIVLDGLVQSAPTINSEIRERGQISGSFTQREVENLVNILRAGALPASLKPQPVSESTIGSTLGTDTIEKGVFAVVWAFIAVVVFMLVYYRFAGLVASLALMANLVLTIGFMVAVQATFTLPGLAGLVLMLGMAVDANVLIYERLREERERGASLALSIRNGYDRALPTIIDTHLSSIFTAIVLYVVGNDQLKGFGVSLTVGLIISLFTSLYMTRLLFDIWQFKGWLTKLSMMRLFHKPDIDFMGVRHIFFAITIVVSVLGITVFVARLPDDLNIDFRGGTAYSGRLRDGKAQSIQELRHLVDENRQKEQLAVASVSEEKLGYIYKVTYKDGTDATISLANQIEGTSKADREEILKRRASRLPDEAVEQIFPSPASVEKLGLKLPEDSSKSYFFTVRTSEKEAELVQASIDRLFRDDKGAELMQRVFLRPERLTKESVRLRFFSKHMPDDYDSAKEKDLPKDQRQSEKFKDYASPSFIKTLLTRELLRRFQKKEPDGKPIPGEPNLVDENKAEKTVKLRFNVDVAGEGTSQDGRYSTMKVTFTPSLDQLKDRDKAVDVDKVMVMVGEALKQAGIEFENRPPPERLENFDSALAAETRFRAMWAVLASWGAILLYLWFRFGNWTFGLAAVLCLIHDLFFTLGAIAACHYVYDTWWGHALQLEDFKIDLNAVAALLTLVGFSVNDTIVVFDRIREVRGKNPELTPQMINDSVNQTLSRTILTSLTTWLVVVVLFWWGGPGVHLFAFVMVVGVIVGTYSSIYIASPLLLLFGEGAPASELPRGRQPVPTSGAEPAPA